MVEVAEDNVKVDSFSFENVLPFGLRECLGCRGCSPNLTLSEREVLLNSGEDVPGVFSIPVDLLGLCLNFGSVPQ